MTSTMTSKENDGKEVPPTIPSGWPHMKGYILFGLATLTFVYVAICYALKDSGSYLIPAKGHCQNYQEDELCSRPDLLAFQISSGIAIFFVAWVGFRTWHVNRRVHTNLPATPEGRLFGYLKESEVLAAANFTFQVWDFVISLLIPEHRTVIMLSHHLLAATVSYCSLEYQYLHYYGVFYLGLTEVSSIFLVVIDIASYFPPTPASLFDKFAGFVCGPCFAILFFYYRLWMWWRISYLLWTDAFHVIQNGMAEKLRPGRSYVLYIFLSINLVLGLLQVYWFVAVILVEAGKVIAGEQLSDSATIIVE